jgi:hypothetical protein
MEQNQKPKVNKAKTATVATVSIRVKRETKRKFLSELAKVNKKEFGKNVGCDELMVIVLALITEQHIKALQAASLSNADRLEIQYREFVKKNGATSKDDFLGKILSGNVRAQEQSVTI